MQRDAPSESIAPPNELKKIPSCQTAKLSKAAERASDHRRTGELADGVCEPAAFGDSYGFSFNGLGRTTEGFADTAVAEGEDVE